jgi:hypothetical protein
MTGIKEAAPYFSVFLTSLAFEIAKEADPKHAIGKSALSTGFKGFITAPQGSIFPWNGIQRLRVV